MDGVCAVVVAGSEPATAVAVAVGAARVQSAGRRVAVADLVGDAPLILRLLPDDDPHGISDSFLYGVSFNRIARTAEGEEQLFLIPSGTEPVTTEEIYANERWRRLAAGFHQVGALLVIVARPEVPGFGALCAHVGAVLPVGALPVAVPEGVTVLRLPEDAATGPGSAPPSPLEALLRVSRAVAEASGSAATGTAASGTASRPGPGERPSTGAGGGTPPDTAHDDDDNGDADDEAPPPDDRTAVEGRRGLQLDPAGIVRPKAKGAGAGREAETDEPASPWWRARSTVAFAVLAAVGLAVGSLHPEWVAQAGAPLRAAWARVTGPDAPADSLPPGARGAAIASPAVPEAPAGDSAVRTDTGRGADSAGAPDSAARVAAQDSTGAAGRADSAAARAVPPAPAAPSPKPVAASAPTPPAAGAVPAVANPEDAGRAARCAIYVATSHTREGALPDPRLRGAEALALSPVTDGGTRWFRLTVGAEPTRGEAEALLTRLRGKDPTVSGSIVSLPYAFLLERGVAAGQASARVGALTGRGVFPYALRQPDGSVTIYTGAFESPAQARTLADSLRGVGLASTLVYRTGRAF